MSDTREIIYTYLNGDRNSVGDYWSSTWVIKEAAKEIDRLERLLQGRDEALRDARRMDFADHNLTHINRWQEDEGRDAYIACGITFRRSPYKAEGKGLREAIDAAIEQESSDD
jgi:hypothetical protein